MGQDLIAVVDIGKIAEIRQSPSDEFGQVVITGSVSRPLIFGVTD